ncbi:hypothetical protein PSEUBRA_004811 [Kalmanozyma brasiliensis GHG001]|uniref:uncharacterized protein n=1 Tax=Kalmanozyma brasiliensis (strain GHG001) TaxID=1365824 RepID=UPI002867DEEE|nr:uncharacterized protein PSEUBRA_004811 [Kalmanozyma brasiliensis GHG001]KAF6767433.1 hypothetical protein PSEUBRA_004811 [Kalmanozyma brasiliensis GHG001]
MLDTRLIVVLAAFKLAPIFTLAQPSDQAPVTAFSDNPASALSAASDSSQPVVMPSPAPLSPSFWDNLARHWIQADSTKQTLMAVLLIIQIVVLFSFIKRSFDKMFGRRAEYRNQRTKRFARRAAAAAAGGSSKIGIPLSHHRPLYRPDSKPQLPPRPSQDHPLMRSPSTSTFSQAAFQTTPTGDIVLPSWTQAGPTPLRVIVEEPEDDSRSNSPISSRPHSPAIYRDSQRSPVYQDISQQSWSMRSASPRDSASLRLRERNDSPMLPFAIDRSSTPDTRLEDVKRPFSRAVFSDDLSGQSPFQSYYTDPLSEHSSLSA